MVTCIVIYQESPLAKKFLFMEYTAWGVVYTSSAEDFRVGKNMIWTEFRESKLFNMYVFFKSRMGKK